MSTAETSSKGRKRGRKQQNDVLAAAIASVRQERNEALRISEGGSNSPEAPTINGSEDAANHDILKRKTRGKAKALDKGKTIVPVEVTFNSRSQPYGKHAAGFATFLGVSARELVPLTISTWQGKALSDEFRTQIWQHVTTYYIVDECHKKQIFRRMAKLWRDHRSLILKEVKKQAELVGLQTAALMLKPDNIHSMDEWLSFIKSRMTPTFMEKCEKFRRMREQKTLLHRTSRKSFACIEDELKQQSETPDEVSRCDVWLHAYEARKKDTDEEVEDPEVVKQVKQNMAEQVTSQTCFVKDDAVSKVLGPDPRGRVRGYGFGAFPSKVAGQTYVGNKLTMLENALSATTQELQELKMVVKTLLARSEKGGNKQTNSAQHSATEIAQSQKTNTTARGPNHDGAESKKRKQKDVRVGGSDRDAGKQSKQRACENNQSTAIEKEGACPQRSVPPMKKLHLLSCWIGVKKLLQLLIFTQRIQTRKCIVFLLVLDVGKFGYAKSLMILLCFGQPKSLVHLMQLREGPLPGPSTLSSQFNPTYMR